MTRTFRGTIRYFRPEASSGLAVVDMPPDIAAELGGLKQMKVVASINGTRFDSNTMPAGGGRLALSLNRKVLADAGVVVGADAEFQVERR